MNKKILRTICVGSAALTSLLTSEAKIVWEDAPRVIFEQYEGAHDAGLLVDLNNDILAVVNTQGKERADIQFFRSGNGGDYFGSGVDVSPRGVEIQTRGENAPSMVHGVMGPIVLWGQQDKDSAAIMVTGSMNEGASFLPPIKINDGQAGSSAYFGELVAGQGRYYAAWLDSRDNEPGQEETSIYFSRSDKSGRKWEANVRITNQACPCCRPSLLALTEDKILAVWRSVYPDNIRDFSYALSEDGGATWGEAKRLAKDNWYMPGCPVMGARVATVKGVIYVTWYSGGSGKETSGIRVISSTDDGKSWGEAKIVNGPFRDAGQPFLASVGDEMYLLFRARAAQKNDSSWSAFTAHFGRVEKDGKVKDIRALPANESISWPKMASDFQGRLWVSWQAAGKVELIRGRKVEDES